MKLVKQVAEGATAAVIRILSIVIVRLSDRTLARLLRATARLAFFFSADDRLTASIAEVADIFEIGSPYSCVPRKVLASMHTDLELVLSTLACLRKPSPYGAE